ncbi:RloB family protein [Natronospora cellulosivora (SeqCode)]
MSPLREIRQWTSRYKEDKQINPLRRYYLIFEGAHTELKYFEGIVNNRKILDIHSLIELVILDKDGDIENHSHPKRLYDLINKKKSQLENDENYNKNIDKFVIIFDRDSYRSSKKYLDFVKSAEKENILGVTNPCFELWLLLHRDNIIEDYINIYKQDILENKRKSNKHTFISKLFSDLFGMNSKSNLNFEELKDFVNIAIINEKKLEQCTEKMKNVIGSNIGLIIEEMKQDPRDALY